MKEADVLIVGAGPAGTACARRLSLGGMEVLLLDKATFPREKPCAGWITPEVLKMVSSLFSPYPYDLTEFRKFLITVKRVSFKLPVKQYAVRRIEFDPWLVRQCSVPLLHHEASSIEHREGRYIIDGEFCAKYLIGAGGTRCPVYRNIFEDSSVRMKESFVLAMEEEFPYPDADALCRLWFLQDGLPGYAWYVPKKGGYVNIGIGGKAEGLRKQGASLKYHWDRFVGKLDGEGLVRGHDYRPSGWNYYLRDAHRILGKENAFLIGDAAGLSTRDMGEGIAAAIQSGIKAADAILENREYQIEGIRRYSLRSVLFRC